MTQFSYHSPLRGVLGTTNGEPETLASWVLGQNTAVRKIAQHAERISEVQCTVLISGETGTGKEIWARELHRLGSRAIKPFLPVNCAALTVSLAESQLFGHEKGAFTGATGSSLGVFRAAEGGVVFLDEIGEMPLELQPKLLRVLQQREVTPVGATSPTPIDVQIVAATNRNLEVEVAAGRFREDLFYRLNMVELKVPALRDRVEDIPEFIEFFSRRFAQRYQRPVWQPDAATMRRFCEYRWPGNIRQLSQLIEQSYVLDAAPALPDDVNRLPKATNRLPGDGNRIVGDTPAAASSPAMPEHGVSLPTFDLATLRSEAIRQALRATRGHKGRAAGLLGVHANTLTRLLSQLDNGRSDGEQFESPRSLARRGRRTPK